MRPGQAKGPSLQNCGGGGGGSVAPVDYFSLSTIVGFLVRPHPPTGTILYLKDTNLITVWFRIGGRSNSPLLTFTLPYINNTGADIYTLSVKVYDDAVMMAGPGLLLMPSGVDCVQLFLNGASDPFHFIAQEQKEVWGIFSYYT